MDFKPNRHSISSRYSVSGSDENIINILEKKRASTFNDLFEYESSLIDISAIISILKEYSIEEEIINKTQYLFNSSPDAKMTIIYIIKTYDKNKYILSRAIVYYVDQMFRLNKQFSEEEIVSSLFLKSTSFTKIKTEIKSPVNKNINKNINKRLINTLKKICPSLDKDK